MQKIISYIGSKVNLFDFLDSKILDKFDKNNSQLYFYDLFAGTNSVAMHVLESTSWNVITNDLSKYSYILSSYLSFSRLTETNKNNILYHLERLNNLPLNYNGDIFNEFSAEGTPKTIDKDKFADMFSNQPYNSRMFFSKQVGAKIDVIKDELKLLRDSNSISQLELHILLTFLIYYSDRNANTTSVYGAYLKNEHKMKNEKDFFDNNLTQILRDVELKKYTNTITSLNTDIINAIKASSNIDNKYNIIYLDPPYNSRSYESNYHILEYIINLDFDISILKQNSKTAQYVKSIKNPFTSKRLTAVIFKDMITESIQVANNTFISYNTDGLMQQCDIESIFNELKSTNSNLQLHTYRTEYRRFKATTNPQTKKIQQFINIEKDEDKKKILQNQLAESKLQQEEKKEIKLEEIIWHFEVKDNG